MDTKKVLKKSSEIVSRKIEGEMILLPLYKASKDLNYIYTLNRTAADAWELIDGKRTLGEVKKELKKIYDVDDDKLTRQLNVLINDLRSVRAIV